MERDIGAFDRYNTETYQNTIGSVNLSECPASMRPRLRIVDIRPPAMPTRFVRPT